MFWKFQGVNAPNATPGCAPESEESFRNWLSDYDGFTKYVIWISGENQWRNQKFEPGGNSNEGAPLTTVRGH